MAINMDPEDGVYYSNRSAAYCGVGDYKAALKDAKKCSELKPEWPKGYAREGFAFKGLRCFNLAIESYEKAREFEDEAQQAVQIMPFFFNNITIMLFSAFSDAILVC